MKAHLVPTSSAGPDPWTAVRRFMLARAGVLLGEEQRYLLESRLAPIVRRHGFASLAAYVEAACAATAVSPLAAALIDAMTTHETLFFRDAAFWRVLEEKVLPQVMARGRGVRLWSAACSTGQEAWSLAMLLEERFPALAESVDLIATDISAASVARGRAAVYSALETARGLDERTRDRHFDRERDGYRVKARLRHRVRWQVQSLIGEAADPEGCDVVMCRNALIYFSDEARAVALRRIGAATRAGGFIGVGAAETVRGVPVAPGWYAQPHERGGST